MRPSSPSRRSRSAASRRSLKAGEHARGQAQPPREDGARGIWDGAPDALDEERAAAIAARLRELADATKEDKESHVERIKARTGELDAEASVIELPFDEFDRSNCGHPTGAENGTGLLVFGCRVGWPDHQTRDHSQVEVV